MTIEPRLAEPRPRQSDNIVEWVAYHLEGALEFAERDILATRRARRYHADLAVSTGRCAIGHNWREGGVPMLACGYCQSAREHEAMWVAPDPSTLVAVGDV